MKNDDDAEERHKVGYRSPPIHSRFKPGTSGNPKGRPKPVKTVDIRKDLQRVFLKDIQVTDGAVHAKMASVVALLEVLLRKGIKGDTKAATLAIKLASQLGVLTYKDENPLHLANLTDEEHEKLMEMMPLFNKMRGF